MQARFQMKHFGAVCKGGIHFGSCHLHCNWERNRKTNLDLLQGIGAMLGTPEGSVDYWRRLAVSSRRTLRDRMAQDCERHHLCSGSPNVWDRILDDFAVSEGLSQAGVVVAACVIDDADFKPHSPSCLIVKANARAVMVRQLKVPAGFGAALPYGPAIRQSCPQALRNPNPITTKATATTREPWMNLVVTTSA